MKQCKDATGYHKQYYTGNRRTGTGNGNRCKGIIIKHCRCKDSIKDTRGSTKI